MLEDLQSSRMKFDLEHCEDDLCWSRSESEGRKGRLSLARRHIKTSDAKYQKWKARATIYITIINITFRLSFDIQYHS